MCSSDLFYVGRLLFCLAYSLTTNVLFDLYTLPGSFSPEKLFCCTVASDEAALEHISKVLPSSYAIFHLACDAARSFFFRLDNTISEFTHLHIAAYAMTTNYIKVLK